MRIRTDDHTVTAAKGWAGEQLSFPSGPRRAMERRGIRRGRKIFRHPGGPGTIPTCEGDGEDAQSGGNHHGDGTSGWPRSGLFHRTGFRSVRPASQGLDGQTAAASVFDDSLPVTKRPRAWLAEVSRRPERVRRAGRLARRFSAARARAHYWLRRTRQDAGVLRGVA